MSDIQQPAPHSAEAGRPPYEGRLRLGHISYSNCFPVHARLIDAPRTGDPALVEGIPSTLNDLLSRGEIDVGPCSSIEYALNPERYTILPDLVIGARGDVRSIILASAVSPDRLDDQVVAIPTASATSVVLLKILLKKRWGASARFRWFDQSREDPFETGARAALFIGDVALRPDRNGGGSGVRLDLGMEWWEHTQLPFAFAVWQVATPDPRIEDLHARLLESRKYGETHRAHLARRYAAYFRMSAEDLERYWGTLIYDLDPSMVEGLQTFYRLAFEIGELPRVPALRWFPDSGPRTR